MAPVLCFVCLFSILGSFRNVFPSFFIHSSVDGCLDRVHVLAVVICAAVNVGVHVSFRIVFFSEYMPGVGLQGHVVALFLVF